MIKAADGRQLNKDMKDEEIKQAAIDEAQNYDDPDVRTVVCNSFRKGLKLGLKKRDEYAEEYAKAFLHFVLTNPHKSKTYDQSIVEFNESLKK